MITVVVLIDLTGKQPSRSKMDSGGFFQQLIALRNLLHIAEDILPQFVYLVLAVLN